MSNDNGSALATTDDGGMAAVAESLVTKGDISGLSAGEKARYYVHLCASLGLNPATQPFLSLKLNGKEILYAGRGCTDQLAAMHRINREIIDGPRVVEIAKMQVATCTCRATHPNGRVETAMATLPVSDPAMLYMKLETKAKRRATLSILGLGMLDETEVESIPARHKESIAQIDATHVRGALEAQVEPLVLQKLRDDLAQLDGPTVTQVAAVWVDLEREFTADTIEQAQRIALDACPVGTSKAALKRAVALEHEPKPAAIEAPAEAAAPTPQPAAETPPTVAELVEYYAKARTLDELHAIDAETAKLGLGKQSKERRLLVGARTMAVARLTPKPPPTGSDAPAANDGVRAEGGGEHVAEQAGSQASLLAAINAAKQCDSSVHLIRHVAIHVSELPAAQRQAYRAQVAWYAVRRYPRALATEAAALEAFAAAEAVRGHEVAA